MRSTRLVLGRVSIVADMLKCCPAAYNYDELHVQPLGDCAEDDVDGVDM